MAKKIKFKDKYCNLTKLGEMLDKNAIQTGKLLDEVGLRKNKIPTQEALNEGYAVSTPLKNGRSFFMWNKRKVLDYLQEKGVTLVNKTEQVKRKVINEIRSFLKSDEIILEKFGVEGLYDIIEEYEKQDRKGVFLALQHLKKDIEKKICLIDLEEQYPEYTTKKEE